MAEKKQAGYNKKMQRQETRECQECSYHKKCGGCEYSGIPIVGMSYPYYYRNKVHAVYAQKKNGQVICGTYEKDSHRVVDIESCLLEDKQSTAIIRDIRGLLRSFKIKPYNEDTGYGLLRHVLVRHAHATGEVMVVLVIASPILPSKNNFVKALRQMHPEITTVVLNINGRNTSMVLGDQEKVLYGKGYIVDELLGMRFRISAKSFYQVNPLQTEKLYSLALEYAGLTGQEVVWDLYCGIGTISLFLAQAAKHVYGVEIVPEAIADARENAKNNQIDHATFYVGKAEEVLPQWVDEHKKDGDEGLHPDVIVVDPPRKGCDEKCLETMVTMAPERIVYVSCDSATLARDLKYLQANGYEVTRVRPVDQFCHSMHVETVCLLSIQNKMI